MASGRKEEYERIYLHGKLIKRETNMSKGETIIENWYKGWVIERLPKNNLMYYLKNPKILLILSINSYNILFLKKLGTHTFGLDQK